MLLIAAIPVIVVNQMFFRRAPGPGGLLLLTTIPLALMLGFGLARKVRGSLTPPKPFEFVCRLETLPGVIGGRFKVLLEANLPERPKSVSANLRHFVLVADGVAPDLWKREWTFRPAELESTKDGLLIPIECRIPDTIRHQPIGPGGRGHWTLSVAAELSEGYVCKAQFPVPVYETGWYPVEEQDP